MSAQRLYERFIKWLAGPYRRRSVYARVSNRKAAALRVFVEESDRAIWEPALGRFANESARLSRVFRIWLGAIR